MELIYLWVQKFRNIKELGFNFSSNFNVSYNRDSKNRELKIMKTKSQTSFNEKISNITAIIGKNGSGKTNLLDILGERMEIRRKLGDEEYFIIYHKEDEDYVIEGRGFHLVEKNLKVTDPVSEPYSLNFIRTDEGMSSPNFMGDSYGQSVFFFLYHKFEFKNQFRSNFDFKEHSLFFKRNKVNPFIVGYELKYRLITNFNRDSNIKKSRHLFNVNNQTYIILHNNIDVDYQHKLELKHSFKRSWRDDLSRLRKSKENNTDYKAEFIMNFIEDYVQFSFAGLKDLDAKSIDKLRNEISNISINHSNPEEYFYNVYEHLKHQLERHIKLEKYDWDQYSNTFYKLVEYFKRLRSEYFVDNSIQIPITTSEDIAVIDLLKLIDQNKINEMNGKKNFLNNSVALSIEPLSSGEEAFINLFSSVYFGLSQNDALSRKAIILLDEPDNFMHPEWSRILIAELVDFLSNSDLGYESYQVILTTHSPFIISDLFKSNVIALDKDSNSGKTKMENLNAEQTFASNIHTLLSDKFFMKSTIGEYAIARINKTISLLRNSEYNYEDLIDSKIIIDNIGDSLLKEKLMEMYLAKREENK